MARIPLEVWIGWLAGVAIATSGATAFVYTIFETKEAAAAKEVNLKERLNSMDEKLDIIIEKL
jgi:hypothetical protein